MSKPYNYQYTNQLYNGTIETFRDFAITCTRAFGSFNCYKDIDDSLVYKKHELKVDNYYQQQIDIYNERIENLKNSILEDLYRIELSNILAEIVEVQEEKTKAIEYRNKLLFIYNEYMNWKENSDLSTDAPYTDYVNLIGKQLELTLDEDHLCDPKYYDNKLRILEIQRDELDAAEFRNRKIKEYEKSIEHYKNEIERERTKMQKSNEWMEKILESLPETSDDKITIGIDEE